METILYLGFLFLALFAGAAAAASGIIPRRYTRQVDGLLGICLYALLFSMGIRTGLIDNIGNKLSMIGGTALLFAVLSAGGSAFIVLVAGFVYKIIVKKPFGEEKRDNTQRSRKTFRTVLAHLKEPFILISIVISGGILAAFTPLFNWFTDSVAEWFLYILLFLVGIQMIHGDTDIRSLLKDPIALALPLLTIIGTLLFSLVAPIVTNFSLSESMAVVAGFGWYSLSGILIADLGDPILGSIAFLSNLFRESLAFIFIPLLAGYGKSRAAISICGATSMDVTLPMVEKSCGVHFVPLSLAHGIILTLVVPFLVPLIYAAGF